MILIFDTETTGIPNFKLAYSDPVQPYLVQLAAQLLDDDLIVRGEINLIIRPEGFEIPEVVVDIHGITTEKATKFGVTALSAVTMFVQMANKAETLVAHNLSFDRFIMSSALDRNGFPYELIFRKELFCTKKEMTDICKLPGKHGQLKWPSLQEAHRHCFNIGFEGAHDAMTDVRACAAVYKWLQENKGETK